MYTVYAFLPGEPKLAVRNQAGDPLYFDGEKLNPTFKLFVESAISKYGYEPLEPPIQVEEAHLAGLAQQLVKRSTQS